MSDQYKSSPGRYLQVTRYKLQIPTPFCSLKNNHSSIPTSSPSYQVLISTISRISNFHTSNFAQPCENLPYQNQTFVFLTLVNMLKDGNWIASSSGRAFVSVGDVDIWNWELGGRPDENFCSGIDSSLFGREGGDGCDYRAVIRALDRENGICFM